MTKDLSISRLLSGSIKPNSFYVVPFRVFKCSQTKACSNYVSHVVSFTRFFALPFFSDPFNFSSSKTG